jgi:ribosomal protein L37E
MTIVMIRCPVIGCTAMAGLEKPAFDKSDVFANVVCERGHTFNYEKGWCPRCGYPTTDPEWGRPRARRRRSRGSEALPQGQCMNAQCDYAEAEASTCRLERHPRR